MKTNPPTHLAVERVKTTKSRSPEPMEPECNKPMNHCSQLVQGMTTVANWLRVVTPYPPIWALQVALRPPYGCLMVALCPPYAPL